MAGAVGGLVEPLIRGHLRRGLDRKGWSALLDRDPTIAVDAASSPVRDGNSVEIFVDGQDAFAGMLAMIGGAQRSVHIAGWHATPDFELTRESIPKALGDALRIDDERDRVRALLWGGARGPDVRQAGTDGRKSESAGGRAPGGGGEPEAGWGINGGQTRYEGEFDPAAGAVVSG